MQNGANIKHSKMKLEPSYTGYEEALSPTFEPKDSYIARGMFKTLFTLFLPTASVLWCTSNNIDLNISL